MEIKNSVYFDSFTIKIQLYCFYFLLLLCDHFVLLDFEICMNFKNQTIYR